MTELIEDDLAFDFSGAVHAFKFDDDLLHASSTMKRVDFIAEYEDCYRFIEVKDPDIPGVSNLQGFVDKFRSGKLLNSLAGKYRDSLLFRHLSNKCDKKIEYIILLSMASLDPALLINKQDNLHRIIPVTHSSWSENCAAVCVILNMETYKRRYGEHSVRRISDGGA